MKKCFKKMLGLFVFALLIISIISVNASSTDSISIGDTEATIKETNYEK